MKELSAAAALVWDIAVQEAVSAQEEFIEPHHLFIAVMSLEKVKARTPEQLGVDQGRFQALQWEYLEVDQVLKRFALEMTALRRAVREAARKCAPGGFVRTENVVHRSGRTKAVFNAADVLARNANRITSMHLMAALLESPAPPIAVALAKTKTGFGEFKEAFIIAAEGGKTKPADASGDEGATSTPYIDRYARDLTQEARDNKLGPFVGRRKEMLQIIQTLARSAKNNPVLVGEAGVGKTAVVEALAVRVVEGKDPQVLDNKRIMELNLGALQGGSKYRGEFEERLTNIIEEVRANPDLIIFIDEIHNLMGAGKAEGSMDATELLKPALARSDFRCIGATTMDEYRRYIELDPALERRFERIFINEPSRDEAVQIIKGIRPKWEKHHGCSISDKAIEAAVDLSIRFDADHQLPDKAIDLVDKAGAATQVPILSMGRDGRAAPSGGACSGAVTEQTVAHVLSEKTGIPLEILMGQTHGTRILELEPFLKGRIKGQGPAIERVCQRLRLSYSGMRGRGGPIAVLLLLGPSGVGKTELARSMAAFLFGSETSMIRIDMSEFMEEHSTSKLIGAPPGYVGYQEEGQLTGRLRTTPYCVVLLDEVEKAHPRVFDLFLQVFDEGRLTDAKGRTIDARNAIFIMTSNIRSKNRDERHVGFIKARPDEKDGADFVDAMSLEAVKGFFRQELINRIDEVVTFRPLEPDDVSEILRMILLSVAKDLLAKHGVAIAFSDEAVAFMAAAGFSPEFGVRELKRTVERLLQAPLSTLILNGQIKASPNWRVVYSNERLSIVPDGPAPSTTDNPGAKGKGLIT
ncbi:MAG: ATP-dependent Clp protease ATP-binding subunit [Deltaproteobacteria bacterium]|nr:ATP-dependent Clp protease ATP-binding subunit [Deltaproteobacteria bacterium]